MKDYSYSSKYSMKKNKDGKYEAKADVDYNGNKYTKETVAKSIDQAYDNLADFFTDIRKAYLNDTKEQRSLKFKDTAKSENSVKKPKQQKNEGFAADLGFSYQDLSKQIETLNSEITSIKIDNKILRDRLSSFERENESLNKENADLIQQVEDLKAKNLENSNEISDKFVDSFVDKLFDKIMK